MLKGDILRIETNRAVFEIPLDKRIIILQGDTLEGEEFLEKLLFDKYDLATYSQEVESCYVHIARDITRYAEDSELDLICTGNGTICSAFYYGELDKILSSIDNSTKHFIIQSRLSNLHFKNQSEVGYYVFDVDASGEKDIIRLKPVENQYTIRGYLDDLRLAHGVK